MDQIEETAPAPDTHEEVLGETEELRGEQPDAPPHVTESYVAGGYREIETALGTMRVEPGSRVALWSDGYVTVSPGPAA